MKTTIIDRPVYDLEDEDGERITVVDDNPLTVISTVICVETYREAERVRAAACDKCLALLTEEN